MVDIFSADRFSVDSLFLLFQKKNFFYRFLVGRYTIDTF